MQLWKKGTKQCSVASFEDRRQSHETKEYGQPLEAVKGKETDFPIEPPDTLC